MNVAARLLALILLTILAGCVAWWQPQPTRRAEFASVAVSQASGHKQLQPAGFGLLRVTVRWPAGGGRDLRGYQAQLIPDSTSKIELAVRAGSTTIATASVSRSQGEASVSRTIAVPGRSNLSVAALALSDGDPDPANPTPIARGSAAGVNVVPGRTTDVALTMFSLYTPAIEAFDVNAGTDGDTVTITGSNFRPVWAAAPSVKLEGTAGASVSASVASATDTEIAFTLPAGAAIGRVEVVADGVPSLSSATFWVAADLAIDANRAAGDPGAATTRALVFDDAITFTATHSWGLVSGRDATDYGTPPQPAWPEDTSVGAFSEATGLESTLTALSAGDLAVKARLGNYASNTITAKVGALGAFADAGVALGKRRLQHTGEIIGSSYFVLGGKDSYDSVERSVIDGENGNLGAFGGAGVSLGRPLELHGTLVVGDYLYLFGGFDDGGAVLYSKEVWRAPIDAEGSIGSFAKVSANAMPYGRRAMVVQRLGEYVYVIGGETDNATIGIIRARVLDGQGNLGPWEDYSGTSRLAKERTRASGVVAGDTLYIIGGVAGGILTPSIEAARFDGPGNLSGFAEVGNLGAARKQFGAASVGNRIYVTGGFGSGVLNSVESILLSGDPAAPISSVTTSGSSLATGRGGHTMAVIRDWLYVVAGSDSWGNILTSIERARIPLGSGTSTLSIDIDKPPGEPVYSSIQTFAGKGPPAEAGGAVFDQTGTAATLKNPQGMEFDAGNNLYTTNTPAVMLKITPTAYVTKFNVPGGNDFGAGTQQRAIAYARVGPQAGNFFVADWDRHVIAKVSSGGNVTVFAGTLNSQGTATGAVGTGKLKYPGSVVVDSTGQYLLAGTWGGGLAVIDANDGTIAKIAPFGANLPQHALAIDPQDNVYIGAGGGRRIYRWPAASWQAASPAAPTAWAGTGSAGHADGPISSASFNFPAGLRFDAFGNLWLCDGTSNLIRKISGVSANAGTVSTPFGAFTGTDGAPTNGGFVNVSAGTSLSTAKFNNPNAIAFDSAGRMFIADNGNHVIRVVQ